MANVSAERDIQRAKDMRTLSKGVKSPDVLRQMEETAIRLEKRAGRKLAKIGKRGPKPGTSRMIGHARPSSGGYLVVADGPAGERVEVS